MTKRLLKMIWIDALKESRHRQMQIRKLQCLVASGGYPELALVLRIAIEYSKREGELITALEAL